MPANELKTGNRAAGMGLKVILLIASFQHHKSMAEREGFEPSIGGYPILP